MKQSISITTELGINVKFDIWTHVNPPISHCLYQMSVREVKVLPALIGLVSLHSSQPIC